LMEHRSHSHILSGSFSVIGCVISELLMKSEDSAVVDYSEVTLNLSVSRFCLLCFGSLRAERSILKIGVLTGG